ncbi:MAG: glycosyltransferase family 39 protein [Microcoleaceae cyanobacterium MO_207.B10]|nr:glycosyltransferase family 39 protein [Microcoleaceae cyanobacterium MO_207.B10]
MKHETWLRVPAIIFAVASLYLIYRLGTYLFSNKIGFLSAFLLAISPLFINHAQEIRYYTMSVCLGLLGSLGLGHSLQQPRNLLSQLIWVLGRILSFYTTPLNAAFLIPDILLIGMKFKYKFSRLIRFIILYLTIIFASIPVALSVKNYSGSHRLILPIPGIKEIFRELRIMTVFAHPPQPPYISLFIQVVALVLALLILAAIIQKPRTQETGWVALWGVIPAASIFVFSHVFYSVWNSRYLIISLPYLILLVTIGFFKILNWQKIIGSILAFVYMFAVSLGLVTYYTSSSRYMGALDHYRPVARLIESREREGDIIMYSTNHGGSFTLDYYYRGSATIYVYNREKTDRSNPQANLKKWVKSVSPINSRVWFIYYGGDVKVFRSVLAEQFKIESQEKIGVANILLLMPKLDNK